MIEKRIKRCPNLVQPVPAIIQNDVKWSMFSGNSLQKPGIALITDFYINLPWNFMLLALRVNIDPGNLASVTQPFSEQLCRPAHLDAYFQEIQFPPAKLLEILFVEFKIMVPFVDMQFSAFQEEVIKGFFHTHSDQFLVGLLSSKFRMSSFVKIAVNQKIFVRNIANRN
ncbi:MAG: hypothetical protein ACR2OR_01815 [Hyphomicrobiales bacterium]